MDSKLKIGLIGFGRLGQIHARNIAESSVAVLYAVHDIDVEVLKLAGSTYGVRTSVDINEFLDNKLDGVVIASSTSQHLEHIRATARKKIPVFTEKPIGLTLEETDEVLQEIVNNNVPFQIGFQRRWDPRYRKVKDIIESGDIGKPLLIKAYGRDPDASNRKNWGLDKNGGLFLNAAIHDYDIARHFFNSEITKISANGAAVMYHDLSKVGDIDTCSTTLFMADGRLAMTEWSRYATYGYDIGLEIICSEGAVKIGRTNDSPVVIYHKDKDAPSVFEIFADAFRSEIDGFLNSILTKQAMTPGVEDARIALQLALAARKSHTSGRTVSIPSIIPLKNTNSLTSA